MSDQVNTKGRAGQQDQEEEPQPPVIVLTASGDGMELVMVLQKPAANTRGPVYEDVMAALAEKGVTFGINEIAIQAICRNPMFNHPMTVAKGVSPGTGRDGFLKYLVNETRDLRPKLREDGTADYRDIGYVQNVRKGQPLCEIHPPQKGRDGSDIYGNVLEGKYGREPRSPQGKNTEISEDKTMLLASVDGNVEVLRGVVNVMDTMSIKGNVDNSTGDIHFVGDIVIAGDVVSGFNVSSEGSITVKGSVEGAALKAAGDIIVGQGINGMGRGSIIAAGSIKCRYIQSCYIQADENIYADSIMYCTLECGGNVELGGKRATLIGGRSTIAGVLSAKTIGTDTHVQTPITMAGLGTKKNRELQELEHEIAKIDAENVKLLQIMARSEDLMKQGRLDAEQAKAVLAVKQNYLAQAERRKQVQSQLKQTQQELLEASKTSSYILCKGRVHSGVQITFGPLIMTVNESFVNSRICIVDNDIRVLMQ